MGINRFGKELAILYMLHVISMSLDCNFIYLRMLCKTFSLKPPKVITTLHIAWNEKDSNRNLQLPRKAHLHMEVKPGDRIYHVVSGSGGHGDPWEREPEKVLADVKD